MSPRCCTDVCLDARIWDQVVFVLFFRVKFPKRCEAGYEKHVENHLSWDTSRTCTGTTFRYHESFRFLQCRKLSILPFVGQCVGVLACASLSDLDGFVESVQLPTGECYSACGANSTGSVGAVLLEQDGTRRKESTAVATPQPFSREKRLTSPAVALCRRTRLER